MTDQTPDLPDGTHPCQDQEADPEPAPATSPLPDLTPDDLAATITLLGYDPDRVAAVIVTPGSVHAIAATLVEPPAAPEEATDADT